MAGNLSFIILFSAAIAVSDLYPPGGCALRRRSLKVLTSAGVRSTSRFPARRGPELGGTGCWVGGGVATMGTAVPSKMVTSELGSVIIVIVDTHHL